jgi:hypothetical protein
LTAQQSPALRGFCFFPYKPWQEPLDRQHRTTETNVVPAKIRRREARKTSEGWPEREAQQIIQSNTRSKDISQWMSSTTRSAFG